MSTFKHLLLNLDSGILTVTINRPDQLNALNTELINELGQCFDPAHLDSYDPLSGVIITGAGEKAFVAGADIKEFADLDEETGSELSALGQDAFFAIERSSYPVIAAVNGFALGGGCELAMACHMRVASENAKFGQPEVNLGLIPGYGATQRLPQLVGKGRALEMLLTGDFISADEAYRIGLVNHVVPQGEAVNKAKEILTKIGTKAPVAITLILECVDGITDIEVDGYELEAASFGVCCDTEDFAEGTAAFIEKRKPIFKGE
jgi:enoyl-CoA hydratase